MHAACGYDMCALLIRVAERISSNPRRAETKGSHRSRHRVQDIMTGLIVRA
jgi:hypothetical protein